MGGPVCDGRRSTKRTAAVDATLKPAADSCHVCHHEPRVDYCTGRLYNCEVGCCTVEQHTNITRLVAFLLSFDFI